MINSIDLHIHSIYSDGTETPENILKKALEKKLSYISITDHESIEGYKQLLNTKNLWQTHIKVIPGVELHTYYKGYEVHLLGYCIDDKSVLLNRKLKKLREERTKIAYDTIENLNNHGFKVELDLIQYIEKNDIAVTKAHIIDAVKKSNIKMDKKLFYDFFHTNGPNYIPFKGHSIEDAIQLIKDCNGIPILAHPGLIGNDNIVREIISSFKIGIEVYYHYFGNNTLQLIKKYENFAKEYHLSITGGSDYHGNRTPAEIGDTYVPIEVIGFLK